MHKNILSFILLVGTIYALFTLFSGGQFPVSDNDISVAEEWMSAATDRQWAASFQRSEAEELRRLAQGLRKKEYLYDLDRKSNMNRAGEMEFKAGELELLAFQNYEKAVENANNAAREYRKTKEKEKERQAFLMADQSKSRAIEALEKAAESYESSAEAYGPDNADDNVKAGVSAEKASYCRELLARKKAGG